MKGTSLLTLEDGFTLQAVTAKDCRTFELTTTLKMQRYI